jgi:hypothetical protein
MSYRKLYLWGAGCLALLAVLTACFFFLKRVEQCPDFPKTATGPTPAVIVEVERDFGWRTGDVVPITIYVKQFPGTAVDVDGLALEGDFEVRGDVKVDSRVTADGGKVVRVKMNVQSFAFKPEVKARISMTWAEDGSKDWKEVPRAEVSLHTSPTYDGRDKIQQGRLDFIQGPHLAWAIAVLVLSIASIIGATIYIRWVVRNTPVPVEPPRKLTLYEWAQLRFDAAWARIEAGDRSDQVFQEIDHITRRLLRVETVQLSHLDIALSDHPFRKQGLYIIKTCERKLFRGDELKDRHILGIKIAFDEIISRKMIELAQAEASEEGEE